MVHRSEKQEKLGNLKPKDNTLRVIPLGGVGEIGMNCCLYEYNGELLMVDCGQMMPDEQSLGVDYIIPDMTYVLERKDKLVGILLTHAHEDHVGALPFVLPNLPEGIPVYGSEYTIALQKEKIREHKLTPNFKLLTAREKISLGKHFVVEPLTVTHSIIDAFSLAISTPIGTAVHSGDYKMDPAPSDRIGFDFHAFSRLAENEDQGVLLLLSDSTNADRPGMCPSEVNVIPTLERLVREAKGQVILTTFASSLHRIQTVLNIAAKYDRVVFAAGLNMERNIRVAKAIHALEIPCIYESDIDKVKNYPPEKRLILTTGSQGEPFSGLSRMALDSHRAVSIEEGDSVILSARLIPGNEKGIYRLINHLSRRGADIYYPGNTPDIHVSGHGYRDEMRHLINLVNPKFFVPVHGEYRHMLAHSKIASAAGLLPEEINIIENGDCLEVTPNSCRVVGSVPHGRVFVDGTGVGDVEEMVVRDRRYLADDGVVLVILSVDRESGEVLGGPYLHSRGFAGEEEAAALLEEAAQVVLDAYESVSEEAKEESSVVQATVKKALRKFLKKETRRFPVILPVIMEI
jgi:ribonuclease J